MSEPRVSAYVLIKDGPHARAWIRLERTPMLVRFAAECPGYPRPLLMLPNEAPVKPTEQVQLYRMAYAPTAALVDRTDEHGRRRGDRIWSTEYELCPVQPPDDVARCDTKFMDWCGQNGGYLWPKWAGRAPWQPTAPAPTKEPKHEDV